MSYRIGAYLIDPAAHEIRRQDALVPVEPQVFDLLVYLIENRQRTVTKDDIIERVWKGRIVSDANLSSRIKAARQALGDDGVAQRLIRTVHGRGFRFVGEVEEAAPRAAASSNQQEGKAPSRDVAVAAPKGPAGALISAGLATILRGSHRRTIAAGTFALLLSASLLVSYVLTRPAGSGANSASKGSDPAPPVPVAQKAAPTFKDCNICPEMVELPAGEFMMGSPQEEPGRSRSEGLPRRVVIPRRFALGKFEVTVDEFAAFVSETGAAVGEACEAVTKFDSTSGDRSTIAASFRNPGFDVTGSHPAVCVSWHEAQAYAVWLGRRTGKPYRLPSEAEWEYAARAGTTTSYSFGADEKQLCHYARFADLDTPFLWRGGCRSDITTYGSVQVGKLRPNPWGIHDMHGNAWEWVEDCWTRDAREIPADGSAFRRSGSCEFAVIRGGSWPAPYRKLRSAHREPVITSRHQWNIGFRVALSFGSQ